MSRWGGWAGPLIATSIDRLCNRLMAQQAGRLWSRSTSEVEKLASLGVAAVDYSPDELDGEAAAIG
jgi:hypothetical protein